MHNPYNIFGRAACWLLALLFGMFLVPQMAQAQVDKTQGPVDQHLLDLYAGTQAAAKGAGTPSIEPLLRVENGMVLIDASASGSVSALEADLNALGLQQGSTFGRIRSGWLPISSIGSLDGLASLRYAWASAATSNIGAVTSQADVATNADEVRTNFGVDGTGITVGVLSDTYDNAGIALPTNAAADVATGDLPGAGNPFGNTTPVNVLDDTASPGIDEGRAMAQLIHDLAPGAALAFHTAFTGQAGFAQGILDLAAAGADVIVDDVIYFAEPMFQDGIIAQAADAVKAAGIPYFSSAGNSARRSYEAPFRPSGTFLNIGFGPQQAHDFDPGGGVDIWQSASFSGSSVPFNFQWKDPFFSVSGAPGAATDLDICISSTPSLAGLVGCVAGPNVGGDPWEGFGFTASGTYYFAILHYAGPFPDLMKYVWFRNAVSGLEYATNSPSSYGHANAAGASSVGAAFYGDTPPFGQDPPLLESFSSAGGVPIFFDTSGNPIGPELRMKPNITCVDGTNTTFFLGNDVEPDGFPNFFGTSAAAPHAAAIAALLKELDGSLTPDQIYNLLESTGTDMDDPFTPGFDTGFDNGTGYGLCNALAAAQLLDQTPPVCEIQAVNDGPPKNIDVFIHDDESGVASVEVIKNKNATVEIPKGSGNFFNQGDVANFGPPETNAFLMNAEKINQSKGANIVIEVTDAAGNKTRCDPILETLTAEVPEAFELGNNYPNPFNPETIIPFGLPESSHARLVVYDVMGREVVTLVDESLSAGTYETTWDGRTAQGQVVPSGVYLYRLEAGAFVQVRRMTLIK